MNGIKKILILSFCALIIVAQAFIVLVPYSVIWGDNWKIGDKPFWPFMRYPMYANGKKPGDKFMIFELRASAPGKKTVKINNFALRVKGYRMNELLWKAGMIKDTVFSSNITYQKDFMYLNQLIKKHVSTKGKITLWGKTYTLSEDGIKEDKWKVLNSWDIGKEEEFLNTSVREE